MNDLSSQSCEACQIDAPKVPQDQIQILLSEINGWVLIDEPINKIQKVFRKTSLSKHQNRHLETSASELFQSYRRRLI